MQVSINRIDNSVVALSVLVVGVLGQAFGALGMDWTCSSRGTDGGAYLVSPIYLAPEWGRLPGLRGGDQARLFEGCAQL